MLSRYLDTIFFLYNDTAITEIYTLSLHDALPILEKYLAAAKTIVTKAVPSVPGVPAEQVVAGRDFTGNIGEITRTNRSPMARSEEHTSELQSQFHLVCRLLIEKKKNHHTLTEITE